MVKRRLTGLVAGSLACGMAGSAIANDEVAQLREELASMRAELAQVKAQTGASWMDEAREAELRAMVEDVIADASTRTAFQDGGLSAGHDGKFFLEGGGFRMNVSGQIQVRGVLNTSDDRDGDEEVLDGIEVRRAKVTLDGNIVDPKIGYFVTFSSDDSDGNTFLEDVGISYKYDSGIVVTAGRFKLPFLREELISSKRQIAVDRGVSTEFFTLNRADLVQVEVPLSVISEEHGDKAKLFLAYSDGGDSFSTEALDDTVDYAFTARVDGKVKGEWSQSKDLVAIDEDLAIFVGGAIHVQETENTAADDETIAYTVDALMKTGNFAGMVAFMGASGDVDERDLFGVLVNVGYNLDKNWQPFLRYDFIDDDDVELNAVTAGVNYYIKKHNAKFTTDVVWLIDPENPAPLPGLNGGELSDGIGLTSAGIGGAGDDSDQVAVRAQFQLLF